MNIVEKYNCRSTFSIFKKLSDQHFHKLIQNSFVQTLSSGQLYTQQGDTNEHIVLILEGKIRSYRVNQNGEEITIQMLMTGDTCLEDTLFLGETSKMNIQIVEDSTLLLVPHTVIKPLFNESPQLCENLLRIMAQHHEESIHQIDAIRIKRPVERIGYYLLKRHLDNGHDITEFDLPFNKQTIANHLGMTPETFSRALKKIKEGSDDIEINDNHVIMKDQHALCLFCDDDTANLCVEKRNALCKG